MSLHPPVQITDKRVAVGGAEAHFYSPWGCIHPGELGMHIRKHDGAWSWCMVRLSNQMQLAQCRSKYTTSFCLHNLCPSALTEIARISRPAAQ
jgi:hypothetical protein